MAKNTRWGATPDEWMSLSLMAGLTEDLLPVVSNPGARISPDSNLKQLGKVPSLYNSSGEVVGIAKWVEKSSRDRDITRWSAESDYGICIQTRHLRALDIDLEDSDLAEAAVRIFSNVLDRTPPIRRRSDSGKCLLAFYVEGEYTKRILKTEGGNVEFLANGQHFVAVGTHPKGQRYEWVDPLTGEVGLPPDFPTLTREQFEAGWAALMLEMGIEEVIEYGTGRTLKEARRAVDVQDDVADALRAKGYVKSTSRDGRLNIRCPFEAQHSGPSADDTATQYMPAGVGGFEVGHFHCLHAHCANRSDGDFIEAIGVVSDLFEVLAPEPVVPGAPPAPPAALQRSPTGVILTHFTNVVTALRAADWMGYELGRDTFRDELMIRQAGSVGPQGWRSFTDADYARVRLALHSRGIRNPGAEVVRDAVTLVAEENGFDSAQLWLTQVVPPWDGVSRIEQFYPRVFGTDDDTYNRACGLYTWTALAGRVLEPGCKVDMVPILKGEQGIGKSSAVAAIAPAVEFFTELDLAAHDDNMSRMMRGRLVVEFGELRGLHTKDQEAIKNFITRRWENWVPKYREFATTFPRRCLMFGTTNKDQILADETGNRRWLPIECRKADVAWLEANRLQLWAEGRELFTAAGVQFETAQQEAKGRHADYMIHDTWEGPIREWVGERFQGLEGGADWQPFTLGDILHQALGLEVRAVSRAHEMRASDVLRRMGFIRKQKRVAGNKIWFWEPKREGGI